MASFLTEIDGPGTWDEYEVPQFIGSQDFQFAGFVQDNWKARSLPVGELTSLRGGLDAIPLRDRNPFRK